VPARVAADHRRHHPGRGQHKNPLASEVRGGPAPDGPGCRFRA
jgi:hypothetical protein